MAETIRVTHLADDAQLLKSLDMIVDKLQKVEKQAKKTADISGKGADATAGSFNALEYELKQNEAALKKMVIGSKAFTDQKAKVDELRASMEKAKGTLRSDVAAQSGAPALVSRFTGALSATIGTIASVGVIANSLRADLENLRRGQENARLAEVDFGKALGARTISNLPEQERLAVRPLALAIAEEIGASPGGVAESLGTLRSSGADSILEAGEFLKEASKAFPQDLAAAVAISQGALLEARATGNRDAKELIGGLVQAQAVSQVTSVQDFAKAFSAVTASAVQNYGLTPERAKEEAAFFSTLEPKSAEVAATAEKQFFKQVSQFTPDATKDLKTGGTTKLSEEAIAEFMGATVTQRIALLERGGDLQRQFIDSLSDEGRAAIQRRVTLGKEDAATFQGIQQRITPGAQAAGELGQLQEEAQRVAAFAITQGQREAQVTTADLRRTEVEKLTAELEATFDKVVERIGDDGLGSGARSAGVRLGARIEQLMSGASREQVLRDTIRFQAATAADAGDKAFFEQQLKRIEKLDETLALLKASNDRGNELFEQLLQQQKQQPPQPVVVQAPQVRPKEAPVPMKTVP